MTSHIPDQLLGEDSTINANDATYENDANDANGSQTLKTTAVGDTVYKWGLRGRMVGMDTNDDGTADVAYTYDSDGVRVSESANGDTTYYLQDKQNPTGYAKAIEDQTDTGSNGSIDATTSCILGLQVIGQVDASGTYYLLLDGHGSTVALTGTNGAMVEEYAYSAFGEAIGFDANTAKTNWLFGGDGIWDAKSQMTYHLARWRDGHRFVSYDSFEADPSSPAALHKYFYCSSSPVNAWDPSGNTSLTEMLVVIGIKALNFARYAQPIGKAYVMASDLNDLVNTIEVIRDAFSLTASGEYDDAWAVLEPFLFEMATNQAINLGVNLASMTLGPLAKRLAGKIAAQFAENAAHRISQQTIQATREWYKANKKQFANKVHPRSGVAFDKNGWPDFSGHLYQGGTNRVKITLTGSRALDEEVANSLAGFTSTPANFTWHHDREMGVMVLVNTTVHRTTGHSGSAAMWAKLFGLKEYGK